MQKSPSSNVETKKHIFIRMRKFRSGSYLAHIMIVDGGEQQSISCSRNYSASIRSITRLASSSVAGTTFRIFSLSARASGRTVKVK